MATWLTFAAAAVPGSAFIGLVGTYLINNPEVFSPPPPRAIETNTTSGSIAFVVDYRTPIRKLWQILDNKDVFGHQWKQENPGHGVPDGIYTAVALMQHNGVLTSPVTYTPTKSKLNPQFCSTPVVDGRVRL
jgi:hypothetical protein